MKKLFIAFITTLSFLSAQAQQAHKPKLSAFTQQYLLESKKHAGEQGSHLPEYVYKHINNRLYLSALIRVNSDVDQSQLDALGIYIGTRAGSIWTAQIPVENIDAFTRQASGVNYIDLDAPIFPMLDSARKQTRADSAQRGIYLSYPVTGKNVVVGIIDAGFDLNHPTMYDTTGMQYRIKKIWTQKTGGAPPAGYAYGNEMSDSDAIRARGYDTAILSHGTHVAGIAAGSGGGSTNGKYRGMAYESDIVMVGIMPAPAEWVNAGESDIIDGVNYIYSYAASVGKPAVVNLSWGATLGPHDGNSLFSQACDALTGAGKIFVCAAGNNGEDTVHLQKNFTATDTTVSTFVTFSPNLDTDHQDTWVDVWGDSSHNFCLNFQLFDTTTSIAASGYICTSTDATTAYNLVGSNGDTCFIIVTTTPDEYNGKPHAFVHFHSRVHDNICLTARATDGKVNMWEGYVIPPEGYYGYLKNLGYPWAVSGDANFTVSDIGCTRSALTVGAYTSKTSFKNISGSTLYYPGAVHGHIAPFSSFGPTEDYRIKPDITAPGFALASSVCSYDTSYNGGGPNYNSIVATETVGGRTYNYAMLAGTSMASPCAAGIVGMMLQLDPTLTPDSVKDIINFTAITDASTGILPATGTTTWGHGKINAYRALRYLAGNLSVANTLSTDPLDCLLYPNPAKGSFTISYKAKQGEQLMVTVADITGRQVAAWAWQVSGGQNSKQFTIGMVPKGVYFTRISSAHGYDLVKMTVE